MFPAPQYGYRDMPGSVGAVRHVMHPVVLPLRVFHPVSTLVPINRIRPVPLSGHGRYLISTPSCPLPPARVSTRKVALSPATAATSPLPTAAHPPGLLSVPACLICSSSVWRDRRSARPSLSSRGVTGGVMSRGTD